MSDEFPVVLSAGTYDLLHLSLDTSAGMLDAIRAGLAEAFGAARVPNVFGDMELLSRDLRRIRALLIAETDRTPVGID